VVWLKHPILVWYGAVPADTRLLAYRRPLQNAAKMMLRNVRNR
jgi:hypothetical protein